MILQMMGIVCGEGSAATGHSNTCGKAISACGTAPFVFKWAGEPANSIEPELPDFRETTGPPNEAKLAKTPVLPTLFCPCTGQH